MQTKSTPPEKKRPFRIQESDFCAAAGCGGAFVRRRDRRPGRRCGVCGIPEPGRLVEVIFGSRAVHVLVRGAR